MPQYDYSSRCYLQKTNSNKKNNMDTEVSVVHNYIVQGLIPQQSSLGIFYSSFNLIALWEQKQILKRVVVFITGT